MFRSLKQSLLCAGMVMAVCTGVNAEDAFPATAKSNKAEAVAEKSNSTADNGDYMQIDTLVVVGEKESEDSQKIKSRKLKSHKIVDLAEIMSDELVEVSMIRKSGYGNEVSMRGFGQENLKVMVDGGIIEGACGSRKDPALSHINMLTVNNIVVQQGPFDVTRPGCLGGAIDVITKKPQEGFLGNIFTKFGSNDFHSYGMTTSGGDDKVQYLLGYNYSESGQFEDGDGDKFWKVREGLAASYNKDGQAAKSFSKHDLWGKLQFTPNDKHTILIEHTYGKATDILTPRVVFDTEKELTNLSKISWQMHELGTWSKNLTLSFYRNEVNHYPFQDYRNVAVPKENIVESTITGGSIKNEVDTVLGTLTYGMDVYQRDWYGDVYNSNTGSILNDNLIPSVDTLNLGTFVQIDKTFDKWALSAGVRFDHFRQKADEELAFTKSVTDENRQVDNMPGGHISAKYFLTDYATLFGGVGRSYRTPTGTERYIQGNANFFGNPNLDPTANTEFDFGIKFEKGRWTVQGKAFYSDLKDYIYQESNDGGYKSYTNIDAHIYGGDIKASVALAKGFSIEGAVSYQRGKKDSFPDQNHDRDLGQIAPVKTKLALNYDKANPFGEEDAGLFGTMEWVHSGVSGDVDVAAGEQSLDSWDVMNARMGYRFKSCTLNVGVDNIFDRRYTVANSYEWDVIGAAGANPAIVNEPGRFAYISLDFKF